ncbi:hypothetical protein QFZ43_004081 [Streptomyces afghaniensis]|nr:hypothetical protein [Streptomyces afghaniensis]
MPIGVHRDTRKGEHDQEGPSRHPPRGVAPDPAGVREYPDEHTGERPGPRQDGRPRHGQPEPPQPVREAVRPAVDDGPPAQPPREQGQYGVGTRHGGQREQHARPVSAAAGALIGTAIPSITSTAAQAATPKAVTTPTDAASPSA